MSFFFIQKIPSQNQLTIDKAEAHHIIHVRRLQIGDIIQLFDETQMCCEAKITSVSKKGVSLEIISRYTYTSQFPIKLNLIQGLVKSKKWDLILQSSMELGLETITPMLCERVAAGKNTAGRRERWEKVILAAAKQSERPHLLKINELKNFSQIVTQKNITTLLAHTDPSLPSMHCVLKSLPNIKELSIVIGPEGGFSDKELDEAQQANIPFFSLGQYVLRAETAAAAIVSNVNFFYSHQPE